MIISVVDVKTMDTSEVEDDASTNRKDSTTCTSSSTSEFDKAPASYTYARVHTSPMEIDVPDFDSGTMDQSADSLVSHCELENEINDGSLGYSTLPRVTDQFKLYKIVHQEEIFFLKNEQAQCAIENSTFDAANNSMV
jgi:hypothetical protein